MSYKICLSRLKSGKGAGAVAVGAGAVAVAAVAGVEPKVDPDYVQKFTLAVPNQSFLFWIYC